MDGCVRAVVRRDDDGSVRTYVDVIWRIDSLCQCVWVRPGLGLGNNCNRATALGNNCNREERESRCTSITRVIGAMVTERREEAGCLVLGA